MILSKKQHNMYYIKDGISQRNRIIEKTLWCISIKGRVGMDKNGKKTGRQVWWMSSEDKLAGAAKASEGKRLGTVWDKQLPWMGQKGWPIKWGHQQSNMTEQLNWTEGLLHARYGLMAPQCQTTLPEEFPLAFHCQWHQELSSMAQAAQWDIQHKSVHSTTVLPILLVWASHFLSHSPTWLI